MTGIDIALIRAENKGEEAALARDYASLGERLERRGIDIEDVKAKVAAYHGWDDLMVPPEAVVALGQELTEGGADWQIHAYGNVGHGFTNPKAHEIGIDGVYYTEAAERRSFASLYLFLEELFG